MVRTVSHEEMASRKRVAAIQEALNDAISAASEELGGVSYAELLLALARHMDRWTAHNFLDEFDADYRDSLDAEEFND